MTIANEKASGNIKFISLENCFFHAASQIASSNLFPVDDYIKSNDIKKFTDPIWHYVREGSKSSLPLGDESNDMLLKGILYLNLLCPWDEDFDTPDISDVDFYKDFFKDILPWLDNKFAERILKNYHKMRIEIINKGSDKNTIEFISSSDESLKVKFPEFLSKKNSKGCLIESTLESLNFQVKCVGDGEITFSIKGADFKDESRTRYPLWVSYNDFTVKSNEKILLREDEPFVVCHDLPKKLNLNCKNSDILDINIATSICPQAKKSLFTLLQKINPPFEKLKDCVL